jgi:hypothetical protein
LVDSILETGLSNKESFAIKVDLLNLINGGGIIPKIFNDFQPQIVDNTLNTLMTNHHFLVVAFNLV